MSAPLALVAALDRERAIGRHGQMPWHLPDDFRHFRRLTLGGPVLMGRLTAESIGKPLPERENLVLSRHGQAPFEGQHTVRSLDEARERAGAQTLMVIGGGEIYAMTLPQAETLHLTLVDTRIEGADTWFPAWDAEAWREVGREHHPADARHAHAFDWVDLKRTE